MRGSYIRVLEKSVKRRPIDNEILVVTTGVLRLVI